MEPKVTQDQVAGTQDQGTETKAPAEDTLGLFEEEAPKKDLKWRFIAKDRSLDSILSVFEAKVEDEGEKAAFIVPNAGGRELGDVVRAFFRKAHAAGVTLRDLVELVNSKKQNSK